jgi:hypothetical protein
MNSAKASFVPQTRSHNMDNIKACGCISSKSIRSRDARALDLDICVDFLTSFLKKHWMIEVLKSIKSMTIAAGLMPT